MLALSHELNYIDTTWFEESLADASDGSTQARKNPRKLREVAKDHLNAIIQD